MRIIMCSDSSESSPFTNHNQIMGACNMKIMLFVAAALILSNFPASAQSLSEIANFAQSICGDIPEGNLTRTQIAGKVKANVGVLAMVLGGSGQLDVTKGEEVYKGIPFEKLPDKIPTVAMCKSELAKLLLTGRQSSDKNPLNLFDVGRTSREYVRNKLGVPKFEDDLIMEYDVGDYFIRFRFCERRSSSATGLQLLLNRIDASIATNPSVDELGDINLSGYWGDGEDPGTSKVHLGKARFRDFDLTGCSIGFMEPEMTSGPTLFLICSPWQFAPIRTILSVTGESDVTAKKSYEVSKEFLMLRQALWLWAIQTKEDWMMKAGPEDIDSHLYPTELERKQALARAIERYKMEVSELRVLANVNEPITDQLIKSSIQDLLVTEYSVSQKEDCEGREIRHY